MTIFVMFVFGAVVLGTGAMLSPAWPTAQPRIALIGTFTLAIIVGGTIFYSSLFGWDTLVIDYLLFAVIVGVFLGGTLSYGQTRAEAQGEEFADEDQGWTGPQDLAFFGVIALICALPVLLFPVPPGTDGQGYGYLALATRYGGTFDTLAPFQPEAQYLYSPGFAALTAYLSQQLNVIIPTVQFGVAAVLAFVNIWLAYDFGSELRDKRLGRAMALTMLLSFGLLGSLTNAHFTALLGLTFTQAFFIFAIRYKRHHYPADFVAAGLMLGAIAVSHPGMTIVALIGYVPWLATMWLGTPPPTVRTWFVLAIGVPLVAFIAISPWLFDIADLLTGDIASPFERTPDNLNVILQYHGLWIIPAAILGFWIGWQQRDPVVILAAGWLFFVLDFSTTGGLAALLPFLDRFVNPLGVAWHGPVIPYTILGGIGLLWLWDQYFTRYALTYRQTYVINAALALVLIGVIFASDLTRTVAETVVDGPGTYALEGDIAAAEWLRENTDPEARVLNFPVPRESDWVPVISERKAVYYPALAFADMDAQPTDDQSALMAFWRDPADPAHVDLLREAGIAYVVVPQVVADPDSVAGSWRWDTPLAWTFDMASSVAAAGYLTPVYTTDDGLTLVYGVGE
jgi:hypothetical protein